MLIGRPHWIAFGPEEAWNIALFKDKGIWAIRERFYPEWKALDPDDIMFFFVTKTIKGVVGVGRIGNKFIQDKPLWPPEKREGKVIYPLRFEFSIDYLLDKNDWPSKKIGFKKLNLHISEMQRTVNLLRQETVDILYKSFDQEFGFTISLPLTGLELADRIAQEAPETEESVIRHGELQELILQIGKLNGLISQKEYRMGNERLDVVWRKIEEGVPTYVFEIQVSGDIYHALGKLKHAYDLWNSRIFIITPSESLDELYSLLSGTFHEIRQTIKAISPQKIGELYSKKSSWIKLEKEIGLIN